MKGIAFTIADNPRSDLILSNPAHCLHSIPSHPRLSPMKDSHTTALPRWAWLTVCLLAPVALLNYLDRQMLAAMKSSVMADLPDIGSDANWGRMLGQFKWVYAFLSPVGGWMADRFGRRLTICGSLFAWSAVTWWTGHVQSYGELLTARSLMGISEAFYIPAALALIADYHTGETRSRAVSFHQMGIYCGVILGGFTGYAADHPSLGWRGAFGWSGLIGMTLALPLLILLKDRPRPASASSGNTAGLQTIRALLTNRSFLLLVVYFTLPALAGWVVRDWMPAILKSEFKIGQGKAGVSATLYWQSAAIVGALVGGWLADRLGAATTMRWWNLALAVVAIPAVVLMQQATPLGVMAGQGLALIPLMLILGTSPSLLPSLFGEGNRCTGFSISYSLTVALVGGTVPLVAAWMLGEMGWSWGPGLYCALWSIPSLWALRGLKNPRTA